MAGKHLICVKAAFASALAIGMMAHDVHARDQLCPWANAGVSGLMALRADGQYGAVAAGTSVSIVDLHALPTGSFDIVATFSLVKTVYDLDWGPAGIVAVGDRGSISYIKELSGSSWTLAYSHYGQTSFGNVEFLAVKIRDTGLAVIGGKPDAATNYPVLFQWHYATGSGSQGGTYTTAGTFTEWSRITDIDIAYSRDEFAACEASGSASTVAVYRLSQSSACFSTVVSAEYDDVEALAFSPQGDYLVTAGRGGSASIPGCNARFAASSCFLQYLERIPGMDDAQWPVTVDCLSYRGRPLAAIGAPTGLLFVYMDDGEEAFAGATGQNSLSASDARSIVLTSNGDVYFFGDPDLWLSNLVAGEDAIFTTTGGTPNAKVVFVASRHGCGETLLPNGTLLNLASPILLLGKRQADASGRASLSFHVPLGAAGKTGWFQAVEVIGAPPFSTTHAFGRMIQ